MSNEFMSYEPRDLRVVDASVLSNAVLRVFGKHAVCFGRKSCRYYQEEQPQYDG
jgi:hypothetical protein